MKLVSLQKAMTAANSLALQHNWAASVWRRQDALTACCYRAALSGHFQPNGRYVRVGTASPVGSQGLVRWDDAGSLTSLTT